MRADQRLTLWASAAILGITAVSFWLSYAHLAAVAHGHGLPGVRGWAWPAAIDLFIIAGEVLMLRASVLRRVDPWAIALTAIGSTGSIALNIAGVQSGHPLEITVAAVPPTGALLAFGALMRQVHLSLVDSQRTQETVPEDSSGQLVPLEDTAGDSAVLSLSTESSQLSVCGQTQWTPAEDSSGRPIPLEDETVDTTVLSGDPSVLSLSSGSSQETATEDSSGRAVSIRELVVESWEKGLRPQETVELVGCTRSYVYKIYREVKETRQE